MAQPWELRCGAVILPPRFAATSFVAIAGVGDVAGNTSAVAGGAGNEVCDTESFIGAGLANGIGASGYAVANRASWTPVTSTLPRARARSSAAAATISTYKILKLRGPVTSPPVRILSSVRATSGSGAWSNLSDRTMKTNIASLDDAALLATLAAIKALRNRDAALEGQIAELRAEVRALVAASKRR
jgi:hypothetical protein